MRSDEERVFRETVHDDLYGIVAFVRERKASDEVRCDDLKRANWDFRGSDLNMLRMSLVLLRLTHMASIAICLDVALDVWPVELAVNKCHCVQGSRMAIDR